MTLIDAGIGALPCSCWPFKGIGGRSTSNQHVLIAEALPTSWETPDKFWKILRAVNVLSDMERQEQYNVWGRSIEVQQIIKLAWHRIGIFFIIAWKDLLHEVKTGDFSLLEVWAQMASHFREEGKLWTLHEVSLQVPPNSPQTTVN